MSEIFIEAESLKNKGGWVVDQQSMEVIGSSYIMAHGIGVPVEDASGVFYAEESGEYNAFALTRDWTAVWGVKESAGRFTLRVNGEELPEILGTNGAEWGWQYAGRIELKKGENTVAFHDLTGFNGRCDAVYFTTEDTAPEDSCEAIEELRKRLNWKEIINCPEQFELVVIGGGIAGICTALAAVRSGVDTCLISDRSVLGGCNSSEIRVCMGGMINLPPFKNIGNVVREIGPVMGDPSIFKAEYYEDDRKRLAFESRREGYGRYKIFYNEHVSAVECEEDAIKSVVCTNTVSGKKMRISAKLFSDCSGDAAISMAAGAEVMYGREASSEFGESLAPEKHEDLVMGHSLRWYSEEEEEESAFPDIDWNLKIDDDSCLDVFSGDWEQETGFTRDMLRETEYIRDYGMRAIFQNWSYQKNHYKNKEKFKNSRIKWVSALGGKRESYRVKGDIVLTQRDIEEQVSYDDATACITWSIDMHFPEPTNAAQFGEAFRSFAYHRGIVKAYPVPYRCLYSKDVKNLFLGGRLVSASHVAFSAIRVMRTLGELGEVAGLAAAICKKHDCAPREVYTEHLSELIDALEKGVDIPCAFECAVGDEESYHFKDIGWLELHPYKPPVPESLEKFKRGIKALGLEHKYPLPEEFK